MFSIFNSAGDVDIELSATLNGVTFIPAYNDQSSPEFMAFASNAETQVKYLTKLELRDHEYGP